MTHTVTARVLAAFALGAVLMLAPVATPVEATASVVQAQQPTSDAPQRAPVTPPPEQPRDSLTQEQRYVIGGIGAVVILLVLMLRRARGKAALGVRWRKRG